MPDQSPKSAERPLLNAGVADQGKDNKTSNPCVSTVETVGPPGKFVSPVWISRVDRPEIDQASPVARAFAIGLAHLIGPDGLHAFIRDAHDKRLTLNEVVTAIHNNWTRQGLDTGSPQRTGDIIHPSRGRLLFDGKLAERTGP